MNRIVECIPNFSEGRNLNVIKAIADAINSMPHVAVLHTDVGYDANRTVITFAGAPETIVEAAFQGIKKATELIDMRKHKGEHPRMGATDVFPMVPVSGISMEETIALSKQLAKRVAEELGIHVYLYEHSTSIPERKSLANCRKGEYEGMSEKIMLSDWKPDFGPQKFNLKSGITVIGARKFLIAYNINLNTSDTSIAKKIAARLRESGYLDQEKNRIAGALKAVRAIGWFMEEYDCAQVSTNIIDIDQTTIHKVFETTKKIANEFGVTATGSELIGLIPEKAMLDAGKFYCGKFDTSHKISQSELINCAIEGLGLNQLQDFNPKQRILEQALNSKIDENKTNF